MPEPAPLVGAEVDDPRWQAVEIGALAERAARAALTAIGRDPDLHEIGLLACDDARMAKLNGEFRGKGQPTNVLSWPAFEGEVPRNPGLPGEGPLFIGDIALGFDTCAREAEEAGIPLADHAAHLVVHGVLHLLGHDHLEDDEAETMEEIETKVLASMGVANPYSR
jgi:probable rRNA maturation factor